MQEPTKRDAPSRDRWLFLILLLSLILRSYHLAYPPWDYHNWRQSHTLMVPRYFARQGFHLWSPQLQWIVGFDSTRPTYHSGEFSVISILTAILYHLFGESDVLARIVVIAFSLFGIYSLYALLDRRAGRRAACLGAFVYAVLPYSLFFGRVFMPDIPALSLALGALDRLDRWTDNRKWNHLLLAASLFSLAVLEKLTVAFVALPALYMFWLTYGRRLFVRAEVFLFAAVAAIPSAAWYVHAAALGRLNDVGIMPVGNFAKHLGRWLDPSFMGQVLGHLASEAFSPLGLALSAAGLLWRGQGRAGWIFKLWALGAGGLLLFIPDTLAENYYYLLLLVPAGGALGGLALADIQWLRKWPAMALVLALLVGVALRYARPLYQIDRAPYDLGRLLNGLSNINDLLITQSGGSPNVLYASERRGWLGASFDFQTVERMAQNGARYYASPFPPSAEEQRALFPELNSHFQHLSSETAAWPVYYLAPPPARVHSVAVGEIQNPIPADFAGQIELLGTSQRAVLDWPASFVVIYYWQCLKKIPNDLRVFVHVVGASGQVIYQQDHWPQDGHAPTSTWEQGEIIRERYVLVLPNGTPAGSYKLRVGWIDPRTGQRLPNISPVAPGQDDFADVADFEVHAPPRYGWLSVAY